MDLEYYVSSNGRLMCIEKRIVYVRDIKGIWVETTLDEYTIKTCCDLATNDSNYAQLFKG